jgi:N-methylhydantoinase B
MDQKPPRPRAARRSGPIDPIDLEVLWSRLLTVVDEAAYAIIRTSMSKVVTEGRDFGVVLFDPEGHQIAADVSIASKTGTISIAVQEILKHFPPDSFRPGDIVATNNPWWIMGHLNDIAVIGPLFHNGVLVGFAECMAHMADIGGSLSGAPREVFEEGLIIPPLRIVREGTEDGVFFAMLEANVRVPGQVCADVRALIAGCRVMERKLAEFLDRHEFPDLRLLGNTIIAHSEATMRRAIAAVIPDGEYNGSTTVDGFGEPLTIQVRVTAKGGNLEIDFAGTAAQSPLGINCTLVYTRVWSTYIVKCIASPRLPNNAGTFAPITVKAPEGCFLNPRFPAPVKMKPSSGHYVPIAILDALAEAIPSRVLAESGNKFLVYISGTHASGQRFSDLMFVMGGMGARAGSDGLTCMSFPANSSNLPTEVLESAMPFRVLQRALRPDSGGAGTYRGGLGQVMEVQSLSDAPITVRAEHGKLTTAPRGLKGGLPGSTGRILHNGREVPDKLPIQLQKGDVLTLEVPGSGGMLPAAQRDPAKLAADLADGFVSAAGAKRDYGRPAAAATGASHAA